MREGRHLRLLAKKSLKKFLLDSADVFNQKPKALASWWQQKKPNPIPTFGELLNFLKSREQKEKAEIIFCTIRVPLYSVSLLLPEEIKSGFFPH